MNGITLSIPNIRLVDVRRCDGVLVASDAAGVLIETANRLELPMRAFRLAWIASACVDLMARLPWLEWVELVVSCEADPEDHADTITHLVVRSAKAIDGMQPQAAPFGPDLTTMHAGIETVIEGDMNIEPREFAEAMLHGKNVARITVERALIAHLIDRTTPVGVDAAIALWPHNPHVQVMAQLYGRQTVTGEVPQAALV